MDFIYADPNKIKTPSVNLTDSFIGGMALNQQLQQQQQQRGLAQLLALNTDANGNVDYKSALAGSRNGRFADQNVGLLGQMLQQQKATQAKAAQDALKFDADLNKTYADTGKVQQDAVGKSLENGQVRVGAINKVFQMASLTGNKANVLKGLRDAHAGGLISADEYMAQKTLLDGMSAEDVMKYAQGISFSGAKDPASILFQTADNVADNIQSDNNSIRSTQAQLYGIDKSAETADKNREQQDAQFQQKQAYEQQKLYFEQNKPISFQVGNDGYQYAIYANGKGMRVLGEDGQPIQAVAKGNVQLQNSQREENTRIQRIDAILPEIEKILPNATSSYVGAGVDWVGRLFGGSTDGAEATAQLKTLAGQLVSLMPKMSGPQSDKDVAMYKEMAGNLADNTLPLATRTAALQAIRALNEKYKELAPQNAQSQVNALQFMP